MVDGCPVAGWGGLVETVVMASVPPPGVPDDRDSPELVTVAGAPGDLQRRRLERRRGRRGPEALPDAYDASNEKGVVGEELVGGDLERFLAGTACEVIHSVRFLGFGDIDHIVIGPGGITVVDAKNWTGSVVVTGGVPRIAGWGKGDAVDGLARQVAGVRLALLHAPAELRNTPVRGVMCLAAEPGRPVSDLRDGLALSGSRAAAEIAARAGTLNDGRIARLRMVLIDQLQRVTRTAIDDFLRPVTGPPAIPSPAGSSMPSIPPPQSRQPTRPARTPRTPAPKRTTPPARGRRKRQRRVRELVVTLLSGVAALAILADLSSVLPSPARTVSTLHIAERLHHVSVEFVASPGPVRVRILGDGPARSVMLTSTGTAQVWTGPRIASRARRIRVRVCIPIAGSMCDRSSGATRALTIRPKKRTLRS